MGAHVGVWFFKNRWASALRSESSDHSRRASLVESEFAMRWVALDLTATWILCTGQDGDAVVDALVDTVATVPSIADTKAQDLDQGKKVSRPSAPWTTS